MENNQPHCLSSQHVGENVQIDDGQVAQILDSALAAVFLFLCFCFCCCTGCLFFLAGDAAARTASERTSVWRTAEV